MTQRSRKEIEKELDKVFTAQDKDRLILELLLETMLDIRDLLSPRKNAIVHPPSAEPPVVGRSKGTSP